MAVHTAEPNDPNFLAYRVGLLSKELADLTTWRRTIDRTQDQHDSRISVNAENIERIEEGLEKVNTTLNRLLVGICGSAIVFALSVLGATGKI